jgi:hypothetical protein
VLGYTEDVGGRERGEGGVRCQGGGCHLACVESVLKVGYYAGERRGEEEGRPMTVGPEDASSGIKRVASSFLLHVPRDIPIMLAGYHRRIVASTAAMLY